MTISSFFRVLLLTVLSLPAWAQSDRPQELANGQRVEVMDGVRWVKGTVRQKLQYRPDAFDYEVLTDEGNGLPQSLRRTAPDGDHIRPIQEASRGQAVPLPASLGGVVPPPCTAKLLLNPKTKGRPASDALFRDVIKEMYDENDDPYKGVVAMTVTNSAVGAPYRWAPGADLQVLGLQAKLVYPVQIMYTTCATTDASWTLRRTTTPTTFSCYIDEQTNDWTCAIRKSGGSSTQLILN